MNAFTNYLEKMGSNFLVAAMIPSLAFVVSVILLFNPFINFEAKFSVEKGIYQLIGFSIIVFIPTVIIGFTLSTLNTYVLKIFEGYVIPYPVHIAYMANWKKHKRTARQMQLHRDKLKKLIQHREQLAEMEPGLYPSSDDDPEMEELLDLYYQAVSDYQLSYPENPTDILPTSFGNILKAAENYSGERYGFDGIHFWPRLVEVISKDYKLSIDTVRNELSFLVNMSVLSFFFSLLCIVAMFYAMVYVNGAGTTPAVFFNYLFVALQYLVIAGAGIGLSVFFYKASIFSVGSFGLMIRSSYDLFRKELLKKFEIPLPKNSYDEFYAWKKLNEFMVLGNHSLTFDILEYDLKEDKNEKTATPKNSKN
jgi:hypothetical protein